MSYECESDLSWLSLIGSKKRIEREKGIGELKQSLKSTVKCHESTLKQLLDVIVSSSASWEERHGGLLAAGVIIQNKAASQQFSESIKKNIPVFLEDPESRVRNAAGENLVYMYGPRCLYARAHSARIILSERV